MYWLQGLCEDCLSEMDMAKLKTEVTHAHHREHGTDLCERLFANVDTLARIGSAPRLRCIATIWTFSLRHIPNATLLKQSSKRQTTNQLIFKSFDHIITASVNPDFNHSPSPGTANRNNAPVAKQN